MIEDISKEIESFLDDVIVYYDENKMNNFISQNQKDKIVCFIEEYRNGKYVKENGLWREDNLTLYFYNSGVGKPLTATEREKQRTELEKNVVLLINYYGDRVKDIRYTISPSKYNSLETGITFYITIKTEICNA